MKSYPSISGKYVNGVVLTVFDKLDGSNIRAEWSKKRGFYKFGTRTRLVDETDIFFGKTPQLIQEKFGEDLAKIYTDNKYDRAIAFFEFWGPESFAGSHADDLSNNTVTLIDVCPYKKGILPPKPFIKLYGHLDIPEILHVGHLDPEVVYAIKNGTLDGMTFEGVVCKYPQAKTGHSQMFKIKSNKWLDKLREHVDGDEEAFRRLA
jgi:hypothetical protein